MKAVIIAAGLGNRMGSLTTDKPKALVKVCGRELILWAMDFLDAGDFAERIVVTGYQSEAFTAFLRARYPKTTILYNPLYREGSIKTIQVALPHLDDSFLLMNVDHIYPKRMLSTITKNTSGLIAMCDFDRHLGDDDMKICRDGENKIVSISKTLKTFDGGYVGMTWCGYDMLDTYRQAVSLTLERHGPSVNVEAILGLLAAQNEAVGICDVSGFGWLEIDTQDDLERATRVLRHNRDFMV